MTVQDNDGATPPSPPRRGRGSGGVTGKGFQPGRSGNPAGRPADYGAFRELCRAKSPAAIAALEAALAAGDASSVAAAKVLLEYGYGKPSSAPEDLAAVQASAGSLTLLTRAELLAIARGESPGE